MILVAGATGRSGREICRLLREAGRPVRGLVRATSDPASVETLEALGVEISRGSLQEPASLARACRGAEAVISTVTAVGSGRPTDTFESVDRDGQVSLIDAALEADVQSVVHISFSGNIGFDDPLTLAKRAVERHLLDSGIPRPTVLRPSFFMESWLGPHLGFDYVEGAATIYGSGRNPISFISLLDVARFAVAVLDRPEDAEEVVELGGPEALPPLEVVRIFEDVTGRTFRVEHVPEEELERRFGMAESPVEETFAALMLSYARGDAIDSDALASTPGIERVTVRDYAERVSAG